MDVLNEWMKEHREIELVVNGREFDKPTKRIVCKDGPSKADIDILEAGYKLIEPSVDNHLTYFKHVNNHKIRVIDINKKDYKITCYNKHVLGSSRVAIMTKSEKSLFTAKLEEIGKGE